MGSRCMICNHEKYASSDGDSTSDHDIEQTTRNRFIHSVQNQYQGHTGASEVDSMSNSLSAPISETNNQQSESENKHSKSDNKQSESDNKWSESDNKRSESDNKQSESDNPDTFNIEYSTEEEEEAKSLDEDDAEGNNGENSERAELGSNVRDDEEDASPEIMPYAHHRRKTHKKIGHFHSRHHEHHHIRYTNVVLPSGKNDVIIAPNKSGWKCGMRTRMTNLKPNGRIGRKEYHMVAEEMKATIHKSQSIFCKLLIISPLCSSQLKIIKIQKLVNGCLWRKFKNYQDVVRREAGYVNERLLFHGTPHSGKLLKFGFDERLASTGGLLGAGIYFAEHSAKSNKYAFGLSQGCQRHHNPDCSICVRKLLLCRVTLGEVDVVSMPKTFAHAPPGKHSVKATPGMAFQYPEYVIYRGEQAYPEYLISYKSA